MAKEVCARESGAVSALRDLEVCGFVEKEQTLRVLGQTWKGEGFYIANKWGYGPGHGHSGTLRHTWNVRADVGTRASRLRAGTWLGPRAQPGFRCPWDLLHNLLHMQGSNTWLQCIEKENPFLKLLQELPLFILLKQPCCLCSPGLKACSPLGPGGGFWFCTHHSDVPCLCWAENNQRLH